MSLYLHYEGPKAAPFTCKTSKLTASLDSVIFDFVEQHARFTSTSSSGTENKGALSAECLELQLIDGEKLSKMGSTLGECDVAATAGGTDVFLVDCAPRKMSSLAKPTISTPPSSTTKAATNDGGVTVDSVKEWVKTARDFYNVKAYKNARVMITDKIKEVQRRGMQVLSSKGARVTKDCSLYEMLAEVHFQTGRFETCAECAETAIEQRNSLGPKSCSGSTGRYLNYLLAKAHFKAGNLEESWEALKCSKNACNMKKQASTAIAINVSHPMFHLDIYALESELLFALGKHQQAAEVVNGCMSDPDCEKHVGVLLAYSTFAAQYGKYEEAIRALLKAVVLDQSNEDGKRMLARLLDTTTGMGELQKQLPPSENSASAYAFVATVCKDHSAIIASKKLLEHALHQRPMSASYCLNLMHVIELQGDKHYEQAIAVSEAFLVLNKSFLRVGKTGFTSSDLWKALQTKDSSGSDSGNGTAISWIADPADAEESLASTEEPSVQGGCVVTMPLFESTCENEDGASSKVYTLGPMEMSHDELNPDSSEKEEYDANALDLLAIAFALVKLMFLQGNLHRLAALFKVIEPTRRRSLTPIHQTTVRNEHAYYQTVAQVMAYRLSCALGQAISVESLPKQLQMQYEKLQQIREDPGYLSFPSSPVLLNPLNACCNIASNVGYQQALRNPLYVVGDSHTVPLAWNIIRVANKNTGTTELRLLVPKLVTGLKQYHLRKDSDFYPKSQFAAAIASVPDGSDILFVVGEIDCREGILVGIQRDAYESVRQGMEETITHFAQVLPNLIKKRKMNVFIHPVLPMLAETRETVVQFNEHFQRIMESRIPEPGVSWLDFFDQLVEKNDEGKTILRRGLRMDGTHITPAYVKLIENAIHQTDEDD